MCVFLFFVCVSVWTHKTFQLSFWTLSISFEKKTQLKQISSVSLIALFFQNFIITFYHVTRVCYCTSANFFFIAFVIWRFLFLIIIVISLPLKNWKKNKRMYYKNYSSFFFTKSKLFFFQKKKTILSWNGKKKGKYTCVIDWSIYWGFSLCARKAHWRRRKRGARFRSLGLS